MPKKDEISVNDLVPDGVESQPKPKTTKSSTSKKKKNAKARVRFRPLIVVPIVFLLVGVVVAGWIWTSSNSNGPVVGNRCQGLHEVSNEQLSSATSMAMSEYGDEIETLDIEIVCRTIKIDFTCKSEVGTDRAKELAKAILVILDEEVGMAKSDESSAYSDLLGADEFGKQYEVSYIIQGEEGAYPIFAEKHPGIDAINFSLNTPRDQALVDRLHEEQDEPEEDTSDDGESSDSQDNE